MPRNTQPENVGAACEPHETQWRGGGPNLSVARPNGSAESYANPFCPDYLFRVCVPKVKPGSVPANSWAFCGRQLALVLGTRWRQSDKSLPSTSKVKPLSKQWRQCHENTKYCNSNVLEKNYFTDFLFVVWNDKIRHNLWHRVSKDKRIYAFSNCLCPLSVYFLHCKPHQRFLKTLNEKVSSSIQIVQ